MSTWAVQPSSSAELALVFTFLRCYRTAILERCLRRLEFDKARDAEAKAQADQLEAERMAMQSIDW